MRKEHKQVLNFCMMTSLKCTSPSVQNENNMGTTSNM